MKIDLPLLAIGTDLMPVLDRCVRGTLVHEGWRVRTEPAAMRPRAPIVEMAEKGLVKLGTVANAIEVGRKLASFSITERAFDRQRPLMELAAEFDLTMSEAKMAIRLFIANEKGLVDPTRPLSQAERDAGIRDYFGNICQDFK